VPVRLRRESGAGSAVEYVTVVSVEDAACLAVEYFSLPANVDEIAFHNSGVKARNTIKVTVQTLSKALFLLTEAFNYAGPLAVSRDPSGIIRRVLTRVGPATNQVLFDLFRQTKQANGKS